ncbi:MAG TPA: hypothetical protein VMQ58_02000 [Candidatus Saccharimonadales bacterium]|nr:hypothetical protein [Candidatus Saccharimonadales bacterium]
MDRQYYFKKESDKIKVYGIVYGLLYNEKRNDTLIGTLIYDKKSDEITFSPNSFSKTFCETLIKYLNNLINDYGDELKNGNPKIL